MGALLTMLCLFAGTVEYDKSVTSPLTILDDVNNIGKFTAYIKSVNGTQVETTTVDIKGMSCNSCVNNIQGNVSCCCSERACGRNNKCEIHFI